MLILFFSFICLASYSQHLLKKGEVELFNKEIPAMITVGQKVPESFWTYAYRFYDNGDTLSSTLEHLKGTPIVFDFWASWCSPCISSLIKTNSFIDKLVQKGNFIAVTSEDVKTTEKVWKQHSLTLPSIIGDRLLKQYFPHAAVPQVIWIDADGIVRHQTSQDPLSQDSLSSFFEGQLLTLQAQPVFDKNLPVLPSIQADKDGLPCYQLVLKGYQDYLPVTKFSRNVQTGYFSTSYVNIPLITIYRDLTPKLFSAIGEPFFRENFQIKTDDSIELNRPYTLDLIIPTKDQFGLNNSLIDILNTASGYIAEMEKEKRQCLVLKRIGEIPSSKLSKKRLKSVDWDKNIKLENVPMAYIQGLLADQRLAGKFIVNETGYNGKVDLDIKVTNDLEELNTQLAKSGMKLENAVRDVNVFVIRKATKK